MLRGMVVSNRGENLRKSGSLCIDRPSPTAVALGPEKNAHVSNIHCYVLHPNAVALYWGAALLWGLHVSIRTCA